MAISTSRLANPSSSIPLVSRCQHLCQVHLFLEHGLFHTGSGIQRIHFLMLILHASTGRSPTIISIPHSTWPLIGNNILLDTGNYSLYTQSRIEQKAMSYNGHRIGHWSEDRMAVSYISLVRSIIAYLDENSDSLPQEGPALRQAYHVIEALACL